MKPKKIIVFIISVSLLLILSGCGIPTSKPERIKADITVGKLIIDKLGDDATIQPVDITQVENIKGFSEFVISHEDFVKMENVTVENATVSITANTLEAYTGQALLTIKYIDKESVPASYFTNNDRTQPINKALLTNQFTGWKALGTANITSSASQTIITNDVTTFTQEVVDVLTQDPDTSSDKTYYFMFTVDKNEVWDYGIQIKDVRVNMSVTKKL